MPGLPGAEDRPERVLKVLCHLIDNGLAAHADLMSVSGARGANQLDGDLRYLEGRGYIRRLPDGGAVSLIPFLPDGGLTDRVVEHPAEKWAIAREAASNYVAEGDTVALGTGATCFFVGIHLAKRRIRNITIVTHGNQLLHVLAREIRLFRLMGGRFSKRNNQTESLDPESALMTLGDSPPDKAIVGVGSITIEREAKCSAVNTVLQRQVCLAAGRLVVFLADHSKFDSSAGDHFITFDELDEHGKPFVVITDKWEPADQEARERLARLRDYLGERLIEVNVEEDKQRL